MLFWGAIASLAVGALTGGGGGGGWGSILGGIFGGGGDGAGGGLLGTIFKGLGDLLGGLFGKREEAANQTVSREFQQQPAPVPRQAVERREVAPERTIAQPQTEENSHCCCCCCCGSEGSSESETPPGSPTGGLTVEGNTITTEGGYTIEVLGKAEWKITDPAGNSTRVWGDPHVDEGDRNGTSESNGGWDFKDNTTFILGDGTEVHVTTVPASNGTTVTGQLNVVNGDHHVEVTGMDKGMGQIGEVTTDGRQRSHELSGYQDIYQGAEADDWTYNGREIVGSTGKGDELVLDDEMEPGYPGSVDEVGNGPSHDDGLDDSLFRPMSLTFSFGDFTFTMEAQENDQARA